MMRKEHIREINPFVQGIGESPTLEINERCRRLAEAGNRIFRLGLGQSPFPVPEVVVEELRRHAHVKDYLPVKGLYELRQAVANSHRIVDHVDARAEGVLIGPGSKQLLYLLQLALDGELIVPSPCWVSYVPQAQAIGKKIHLIHTEFGRRWRLTAAQLEEAYQALHSDHDRPKMLILNYPGNPDGGTYSARELSMIAGVARKYGIYVLSDEIYARLHFRGEHVSIARYYPEGTIVSSGLSKWCGAGGWRLGTFTFPPNLYWLMDAMAALASETHTTVCAPVQHAAIKAFEGDPEIERYLLHARKILGTLGRSCARILSEAGVAVDEPEGGFYLFPHFVGLQRTVPEHGITDSSTLCNRALAETGVAMLPGAAFGRPAEELTARIAFVNFDGERALTESMRLGDDVELTEGNIRDWCLETVGGVETVARWCAGS